MSPRQFDSPEAAVRWLRRHGMHVLTFSGYGELGYQHPERVEAVVQATLAAHTPGRVLVATGTLLREGGESGIAQVYGIARALGFRTAGLHPSVALGHAQTHRVAPDVDEPVFVRDDTWGGMLPDGSPSPTLAALLALTDELVVIGGGRHTADELSAFLAAGLSVRYHPAEMCHEAARGWGERAGVDPGDVHGEALGVWLRRGR